MSISVLFVCLGNICRSPTAAAVFRHRLAEEGLDNRVIVDSAGTSSWEVGNPPDARSVAVGRQRGYSFEGQTARQLTRDDLSRYDFVIAMDSQNVDDIRTLSADAEPRLLLDFAPHIPEREVPDPWYHGRFEAVLDMIEAGADGLLEDIRSRLE